MTNETLDAITIRGFRSIASIEKLELRSLNVLIGANGTGKSNFLAAFALLREIREGRLLNYVMQQGGADRILHFGSKVTPHLDLELTFENDTKYALSLGATTDDGLYPRGEDISYVDGASVQIVNLAPRSGGREAGISDSTAHETKELTWTRLGMWTMYHFHDTSTHAALRKTAKLDDNRFLRPDGSNLVAFLYLLRERYPEAYRSIRRTIQRIAPFFEDFELHPRGLQSDFIRLEWRHKNSDKHFDVSQLSDGTLRFIALVTLLLQPRELRPPIILIDEPEIGLHPAAITILGGLVRMAAKDSQVILATQSSLFLDEFEPQDVLVAERVGMGTRLERLDPERLKAWLEDYSLGQLWEKNEIGGRP